MDEDRRELRTLGNDPAALDVFRQVTESAPVMLWMGDELGHCLFLNRAQREFWGVRLEDLASFDWGITIHPDDAAAVSGPFGEGMSAHQAFTCEARYRRAADGAWRWLRTEAKPRFDDDGRFLGMIGVNTDVSDRRQAEERQCLLIEELNHRVKNILATVSSIAVQTARTADDLDGFIAKFSDRLKAMSKTQALLVRDGWEGAGLRAVIEGELLPYTDRLDLGGEPDDLQLAGSAAVSMSLIVHELATNAAKYGALACADGELSVSWAMAGDDAVMTWREVCPTEAGPAPSSEGFGTRLIRALAENDLAGEARLERTAGGFTAVIRFRPAGAAAA